MYEFWFFLHICSVLAFLACHGASMFVLYRIRGETDRGKIADLIAFSGETTLPMYIALGALVVTGVITGITGDWFSTISGYPWSWPWIWAAILVLLITVGLMTAFAKPYFKRITEACAVRPTGIPRKSDEELRQLLRSPLAHWITAIGSVGLLVILWLMVYTPGRP